MLPTASRSGPFRRYGLADFQSGRVRTAYLGAGRYAVRTLQLLILGWITGERSYNNRRFSKKIIPVGRALA